MNEWTLCRILGPSKGHFILGVFFLITPQNAMPLPLLPPHTLLLLFHCCGYLFRWIIHITKKINFWTIIYNWIVCVIPILDSLIIPWWSLDMWIWAQSLKRKVMSRIPKIHVYNVWEFRNATVICPYDSLCLQNMRCGLLHSSLCGHLLGIPAGYSPWGRTQDVWGLPQSRCIPWYQRKHLILAYLPRTFRVHFPLTCEFSI